MNVPKLKKLIKHLKSLPTEAEMISTKSRRPSKRKQSPEIMGDYFKKDPICGTVGCIAGETCMMEYPQMKVTIKNGSWDVRFPKDSPLGCDPFHFSAQRTAAEILGLPTDSLFHVGLWPKHLLLEYDAAKTVDQERKVMIKAINTYMKDPYLFRDRY